jgi:hypothetical protein
MSRIPLMKILDLTDEFCKKLSITCIQRSHSPVYGYTQPPWWAATDVCRKCLNLNVFESFWSLTSCLDLKPALAVTNWC